MTDVLIIGAGPAGSATALALAARGVPVTLVDRSETPPWQIGESLPGAARRALTALGAWATFESAGHAPAPVRISRWGSDEPVTLDTFRDPDGAGWHLDRARFEADLRADATRRGARLLAPVTVRALRRDRGRWTVTFGGHADLHPALVIDATGRRSRLLSPFGQRSAVQDRLACTYQIGPVSGPPDPASYTEATRDGWWYSAALPGGRRLVAFHGDADLSGLRSTYRAGPLRAARAHPGLADTLRDLHGDRWSRPGVCAAHSVARSAAGAGWFAVGDSVTALDPLSSQGLLNALITGLECAQAAHATLCGDRQAPAAYAAAVSRVWQAYAQHHALYYAAEQRWRDAPFWSRRHAASGAHPQAHRAGA